MFTKSLGCCALAMGLAFVCINGAEGAGVTYRNAVLADNPTVYYQFDESAGPALVDTQGHQDGTYSPTGVTLGSTSATAGLGTAASFNGSSGSVSIPATPYLVAGTDPYSIELWYRQTGTNRQDLISAGPGGDPARGWGLFYDNSNLKVFSYQDPTYVTVMTAPVSNDTWYHVVYTRDGGNNASLYLNGALVATGTDVCGGALYPAVTFARNGGGLYLNGPMDEFAFYKTALTATQVAAHYSAATIPEPSTTVLLLGGVAGILAYAWRKRK